MYRDVAQWTRIRRRLLTGGVSRQQIERETGISRHTIRKMMEFPIPPGYRRKKPRDRRKLRLHSGLIDGIVKADQGRSNEQQHTAERPVLQPVSPRGLPLVRTHLRPKTQQRSLMSSFNLCPNERRLGCFVSCSAVAHRRSTWRD
jgi:hypothetical protein